jgi:hypothetical protein
MNHVLAGRNMRNDDLTIGYRGRERLRIHRVLSRVECLQHKIQIRWNLAVSIRHQTHPHGKSPECRTHVDVDLFYLRARRDVDYLRLRRIGRIRIKRATARSESKSRDPYRSQIAGSDPVTARGQPGDSVSSA